MPTLPRPKQLVSLFRPPRTALIHASLTMLLQHWIDHCPSSFNRILPSKQRSIPGHRIAQKPLIGRLLPRQVLA